MTQPRLTLVAVISHHPRCIPCANRPLRRPAWQSAATRQLRCASRPSTSAGGRIRASKFLHCSAYN